MKSKKLNIRDLKVESFVTAVDKNIVAKGGCPVGGPTMGPQAEFCANTVWPINSVCNRCGGGPH